MKQKLKTRDLIFAQLGPAVVGDVAGTFLASKLLKRHFEKAGII